MYQTDFHKTTPLPYPLLRFCGNWWWWVSPTGDARHLCYLWCGKQEEGQRRGVGGRCRVEGTSLERLRTSESPVRVDWWGRDQIWVFSLVLTLVPMRPHVRVNLFVPISSGKSIGSFCLLLNAGWNFPWDNISTDPSFMDLTRPRPVWHHGPDICRIC